MRHLLSPQNGGCSKTHSLLLMAQNKPTFPRSGLHKGKPSSVLCFSKRRKVRTERKKEEEEEEGEREEGRAGGKKGKGRRENGREEQGGREDT